MFEACEQMLALYILGPECYPSQNGASVVRGSCIRKLKGGSVSTSALTCASCCLAHMFPESLAQKVACPDHCWPYNAFMVSWAARADSCCLVQR
jgi:hypothetical protein